VDALLHDIIDLLIQVGPWIVLLVTAAETAVFLGLLVPAEATVLVAAFMAQSGYFPVQDVLIATVLGGLLGDNIGYILGRLSGRRVAARGGRLGRLWRQHEARAALLFHKRSILSITLARFISFVRTLMPWFAGMSGVSYGRFLFFDTLGVLGWGVGSVTAGYLAGRSWHVMASALGTFSTIVVVLIILTFVFLAVRARRRMRSLVRVAVTGNVASGKTAVTDTWRELGATVIDADELARRAVEPGTTTLQQVVQRFGQGVLDPDGSLDRAAMRRLGFGDTAQRRALEAILHPEIERLRLQEERAVAAKGERLVVHSIPLLFETGLDDRFDIIVVVDAPEAVRRQRLLAHRTLDPVDADAMIAAQMPAAPKRERSHFVIDNDAGLDDLRIRAEQVWAEIRARVE
jgi:dephospho-CoA kinase